MEDGPVFYQLGRSARTAAAVDQVRELRYVTEGNGQLSNACTKHSHAA